MRSVQVHDAPVERAEAGQRVAVNLPTVGRRDLARGDVLVEPGHYPSRYRLDVRLEELEADSGGRDGPPRHERRAGARRALRRRTRSSG